MQLQKDAVCRTQKGRDLHKLQLWGGRGKFRDDIRVS